MTDPLAPDPLAFTPVPGRARRDGWTPERQRRFIELLAATGMVVRAARAVGMTAKSAYGLLARAGADSGFARAWEAALERSGDDALDTGLARSLAGERVPVFYRGRQVGEYQRHDDRLLVATLRAFAAREERLRHARHGTYASIDPASRPLRPSTFRRDSRDL